MSKNGFFERLLLSKKRVLLSYDLVIAVIVVAFTFVVFDDVLTTDRANAFVESATPLMFTLIIVIVTSISLIGSLTESETVERLKSDGLFKKFLFTFELTAILALITSVLGIFFRAFSTPAIGFYVFLFFFSYTVLATATTISRIVTYSDKIAIIQLGRSIEIDTEEQVTKHREATETEEKEE